MKKNKFKKKPTIAFIAMLIMFSQTGCNENKKQSNANEKQNKETIAKCNDLLNSSVNIIDYVPKNIESDPVLSKYVKGAFEAFSATGDKMCNFLDNTAEFVNDSITADQIDNKNALSAAKGSYKILKSFAKGAWNGAGLLISASGVAFDYKSNYEEYKRTYSASKMDSLRSVLKFISINNVFLDEYSRYETERIKKFKSIRSTAKIPANIIDDSGLNENLEAFKNLLIESNKVVRLLILNKIKGNECSDIESEINNMTNFIKSDDSEYESSLNILKDYAKLLSKLKSKFSTTKLYLKQNETNFSNEIISDLTQIINEYDVEINMNISNLNIYNRFEGANNRIASEIKKGSSIYFE
jgi:hypothetical protein